MRRVLNDLSLALLVLPFLFALGASPVQAQENATGYSPGDRVEFHFGPRPWQAGEITKLYPATNQVVVRDATGYEQAYAVADVRRAAAQPAPGPAPIPDLASAAPAEQAVPPVAPTQLAAGEQTWHAGDGVSVVVAGGCCYDGHVVRPGTGEWSGKRLQSAPAEQSP